MMLSGSAFFPSSIEGQDHCFFGTIIRPWEWSTLAMLTVISGVVLIGTTCGAIGFDADALGLSLLSLALLWLAGAFAETRGAARLAQGAKALATFLMLAAGAALASAVLATSRMPLADAALARADRWLFPGLDWAEIMSALAWHENLSFALSLAYASLSWQPPALIVLLCTFGHIRALWLWLARWAAALVACLAVFAFLPAVDAYVFFGIPHEAVPGIRCATAWHAPAVLMALRDGSIDRLGIATLDGLITMPSFHAAAAVLLASAWWPLRSARWPAATLNAAMFVSAVPIGGHYIVDLLAGGALAAVILLLPDATFEGRRTRNFRQASQRVKGEVC